MESDWEFVERIGNTPVREIGVRDGARLLALALRGAETQWRSIEEAPKDGTEFLAYSQDLTGSGLSPFVSRCGWHPDAGFCTCELREPTHFIPLTALGDPTPQPIEKVKG